MKQGDARGNARLELSSAAALIQVFRPPRRIFKTRLP
jgi:hypothetical protein